MMEELVEGKWLRRVLLAVMLGVLLLLAFEVLQPFMVPVIWSVILAYVTWPLHVRCLRVCRGQRDLAAGAMTVLLTVCIVLPIVWLIVLVQAQALPVYRELAPLLAHRQLPAFVTQLPILGPRLQEIYADIASNPEALGEAIRGFLDQSSGELAALLGGVGRNLAKLVIAMVSLFFMFRDGEQFAAQVRRMLEQFFGAARVEHYLDAIGATVKAVVYGLVLAALAQGTFAGLGYWVAGVPGPAFLGAITFLVGLVPFMVPFVWSGASLWLFLTGKTAAGIGLFIWGLTAVSWVDNLVRPLVISGATRIPFLMVMFGVLGGLAAFGLVGLFIGPVILAVLTASWREWLAEKRAQA